MTTKILITNNTMITFSLEAGEVLDLPDSWASRLVRGNNATVVEPLPEVIQPTIEAESVFEPPEFKPEAFKPSSKSKGSK